MLQVAAGCSRTSETVEWGSPEVDLRCERLGRRRSTAVKTPSTDEVDSRSARRLELGRPATELVSEKPRARKEGEGVGLNRFKRFVAHAADRPVDS